MFPNQNTYVVHGDLGSGIVFVHDQFTDRLFLVVVLLPRYRLVTLFHPVREPVFDDVDATLDGVAGRGQVVDGTPNLDETARFVEPYIRNATFVARDLEPFAFRSDDVLHQVVWNIHIHMAIEGCRVRDLHYFLNAKLPNAKKRVNLHSCLSTILDQLF